MDSETDFRTLLNHFVAVVNSLNGVPNSEARFMYAEGIAMKLFWHVASVFTLYQGTTLKLNGNASLNFVDHASVTVLTRAAYETALAFHFIFCDSEDDEDRKFRFMCWDYAGYLERQGFATTVDSDEGRMVIEREAKEMAPLKEKLCGHPHFVRLSPGQQKEILKGEWRNGNSWVDIALRAGYSKKTFRSMYKYLCGYAHTGRVSVMQTHQAKEKQKELACTFIGNGCAIMSNFLFGYAKLFPEADQVFRSNQVALSTAERWRVIGQAV